MLRRGFRTRLAVSFLGLFAIVQTLVLVAVHTAHTRSARDHVTDQLAVSGRVFGRLIDTRNRQLSEAARLLTSEFAFKSAVATALAAGDQPTLLSVMDNHQARMNADLMMLASVDRVLIADTGRTHPRGSPFPFPHLVDSVDDRGDAFAVIYTGGRLYQAVVMPVMAPLPIAWVLVGLKIDDRFANDLRGLTASDLSFVHADGSGTGVIASTLSEPARAGLSGLLDAGGDPPAGHARSATLDGREYVVLVLPLGDAADGAVSAVLKRPLDEAMAPFAQLREILFATFAAALVVSVVAGIRIARGISRPLLVLAEGARKIERGDYGRHVNLAQRDEFGTLADAFNNMARGISEREERLRYQAFHDALTGLPNRALFHHLLEKAISGARRDGGQLAILLLDLDRFKEVNDTLGHNIGDLILQQVGPRLRGAVRESDTVARLGGDECVILLHGIERPSDVDEVAGRIRAALEDPFQIEDQRIELSASIGVAFYPLHGEDGTTLLRHADVAMYVAKRSANGVTVYTPEMDPHSPRRLALVGELRHGIEHGGLLLYYQPKVDLTTGRVGDVEALLRWQHPQHGLMAPGEFIPFAEQTGLIGPLTMWALDAALVEVTAWRAAGLDLGVAVNLSARVLQDERFPDRVRELLQRREVPASALILEITESAIMVDPAMAMRIVTRLHGFGIRLSVDDFGTGHSSLGYLKDLPVQELKIDKSFVMDMRNTRSNEVIVKSTIDLAHNLGIEVTAEGVETHEVCDSLARYGCDQAQGFLFSRPLPAPALVDWLGRTLNPLSAPPKNTLDRDEILRGA